MAAHDEQKDGKGLATNLGLYNLSLDLILDSGYSGDLDFHKWNVSLEHTKDATSIILDYLRGDAPRKNIPRSVVLAQCSSSCGRWTFLLSHITPWTALTMLDTPGDVHLSYHANGPGRVDLCCKFPTSLPGPASTCRRQRLA